VAPKGEGNLRLTFEVGGKPVFGGRDEEGEWTGYGL